MGKIFCIMGKSSSGKDSVYKKILDANVLPLKKIVLYTTRPAREGEENGREYFFITDDQVKELIKQNKIIEIREYDTAHGIWKYLTVNDQQIDLNQNNYLIIGTLESYRNLRNYFGNEKVKPIYICVDPGKRLERALEREKHQKNPKYKELCRRFIADEEDFSKENLEKSNISQWFENENLDDTIDKISRYISAEIK